MDITLHTTTAYAIFDLKSVKDSVRLYNNLIVEFTHGEVLNVLKSSDQLHVVFKTTEDFQKFMRKYSYNITDITEK